MIQKLFGMEERKLSSPAVLLLTNCSVNSSSSSTPSMSSPNSSTISEPQQNLRCPRCDSSNTKFCYYNNYNLTQPRHFCKTCRRYWTKGGALRNVPIGGGCRKVKPCRSAATKSKPTTPDITGLDHKLQTPAADLWNPPYSSQLLELLINSQFQNPNPISIKKQDRLMFSPHLNADPEGAVCEEGLCLDSLGQPAVLPFNSLWSNGCVQYPYHQQPPPPQQHNVYVGEMQSTSGIQELLQRLKTSANYNYGSLSPSFNTCMTTNSATATITEPFALSGHNIGDWNSAPLWWFDQQTD